MYHPRANPVERRNQGIKKGLRALLAGGHHNTWDVKIPPILFSIRNRRNDQTGYPLSVLVLGREGKRPGDWELSRTTDEPIEQINRDREQRERRVLDARPVTGTQTPFTYKTGDTVYYKAHEKFHAGFVPKWWGPVKLQTRVGKGVFLTDQQPPPPAKYTCHA